MVPSRFQSSLHFRLRFVNIVKTSSPLPISSVALRRIFSRGNSTRPRIHVTTMILPNMRVIIVPFVNRILSFHGRVTSDQLIFKTSSFHNGSRLGSQCYRCWRQEVIVPLVLLSCRLVETS